jgi:hypothetical protein
LIDQTTQQISAMLKKVHAKLGVCLDPRLGITMQRVQGILREACKLIDR